MATTTLARPRSGKLIAGVCAAISERTGLPKILVRLGFVLFGILGVGEIAYFVLWILIPKQA